MSGCLCVVRRISTVVCTIRRVSAGASGGQSVMSLAVVVNDMRQAQREREHWRGDLIWC